jgi:hypothetical protein
VPEGSRRQHLLVDQTDDVPTVHDQHPCRFAFGQTPEDGSGWLQWRRQRQTGQRDGHVDDPDLRPVGLGNGLQHRRGDKRHNPAAPLLDQPHLRSGNALRLGKAGKARL